MELNIQAIAEAKIQEMHDSGKIVAAIESGIESLIMKSVDSALNGFELKRSIEKQISESVSHIAKDIGFSAYNGFIAEKVKEITESVLREDVALKIQKVFEDLLIARHDGIKLSEIVDKYRQYLFDHVDDQDKLTASGFNREKIRCYALIGDDMDRNEARLQEIYNAGAMPFAQLYQPLKVQKLKYSGDWNKFHRMWSRPAATVSHVEKGTSYKDFNT